MFTKTYRFKHKFIVRAINLLYCFWTLHWLQWETTRSRF